MNKAEIIGLKKNEIKYTNRVKKKRNFFVYSFLVVCILLVFNLTSINFANLKAVFNPVNSLYNDNSDVVFTNGQVNGEMLNFAIPIITNKIEILNDGTVNFTVNNLIMVKSIERGVVEEVSTSNDGIKYIKINHNNEWSSVISNVDLVGVKNGSVVTKGKDVATAMVGEIVSLRIYFNGIQITDINVVDSKIICQK